jgi:glycosyltransferase involved in cell wall biosynthesis
MVTKFSGPCALPSHESQEDVVSVCVCTRRRSKGLERLLEALAGQRLPTHRLEIVIVENDDIAHEERRVAGFRERFPDIEFIFRLNPIRNIARSRNLSVTLSSGGWIAFIDDDEVPEPDWLSTLIATSSDAGSDGAVGRVLTVSPPGTPVWIEASWSRDRESARSPLCLRPEECRTGNAVVRRKAALGVEGPFDEAFGLSGGEDYLFFARMIAKGCRFVQARDARVHEYLEPSRTTPLSRLRRAFSGGSNYVRARRTLGFGPLGFLARGVLGCLGGLLMGCVLTPFNRALGFRFLLKGMASLGKCQGALGGRYALYARP